MFLLELDNAFEKIETHEGWFAPLPAKRILLLPGGHERADHLFEDLICHTVNGRLRVELLTVEVEAVITTQIAISGSRLY